jgi:hypothetical protein
MAKKSSTDMEIGADMNKVIKNVRKSSIMESTKAKKAEASNRDRKKYITEGNNINNTRLADYADVAPKPKAKPKEQPKAKPTPSGEIGSRVDTSEYESPNMGKVNKADKDIDYSRLSRIATDEDAEKVDLKSSGKADWDDPMDQARRSMGFKKGGAVKRSSASKRADGCAIRGKTRA